MAENTVKEDFGADSLEAMLDEGHYSYLHMRRQILLESPVSIRQFRREWFAALKLLLGKDAPTDEGVDTSASLGYWARIRTGIRDLENREWIYQLKVAKNTLLSPAVHRVEIIAHEVAHLRDFFEKYVVKGRKPGAEEVRLAAKFDFLNHKKEWQAIYKVFYKKLKASGIIESSSEYEKHASMLLEKRRQAWADPEWRDGYKARIKDGQAKTATRGSQAKTAKKRTPAKVKPTSTGRVKSHRRRTEKGKSVAVHGYQRKPKRRTSKTPDFVEMGKKAFHAGIMSVPSLDKNLMQYIAKLSSPDFSGHKEIIRAMKQWQKGWHSANLADTQAKVGGK